MKYLPKMLLSLGLLLMPVATVSAQQKQGSLTVSPAYTEVTLAKLGEVKTLPLTFTNHSNQPLTLELFPLNFTYTDTTGTIGFLAQDAGTYSYSLASYLSLEANKLQIDARESKTFLVTITDRPDLSPGGHYGAIIAKIVGGAIESEGAQVAPSLSSLIFLRKTGGERYNLSLKESGEKPSITFSLPKNLELEFQNEGNIHLVPYGTIELKDMFGRVLKKGVLNTSSFIVMPESRRRMRVSLESLKSPWPFSFVTLTVKGNDSLHKTTFLYRNAFVYVDPYLLLFLVLVILGVLYLRKRIRRRKVKPLAAVSEKTTTEVEPVLKITKWRSRKKAV